MSAQLAPLKPHQTPVTRLPRLLTELPFFYLTKKAKALTEPIDFETVDAEGRPMRWKVNPNFGERIGPPSLMAHEVWVRLIKPRIDRERKLNGFVPSLIPLGGVRECLRQLGWSYGGHQAHSLIKAINQIGGAWCEANLWLPTRESDTEGRVILRALHANFSRLSLYAIGANHLTEEDIRLGRVDFNFELDDVLYIKLDPVEMRMLEAETDRPVDNEYLFSISPAARRWYELLAPKFFGVISNAERGKGYCEMRYSWYVKRHHTLKFHSTRKRRVQQLTEVIAEHLQFNFIQKVEYQSICEERDGVRSEDLLIRYYPGKYAIKLTRKISNISRPGELLRRRSEHTSVRRRAEKKTKEEALIDRLVAIGVTSAKAQELVRKRPVEVERQLEGLQLRERTGIRDVAAWIVRAIEDGFDLPAAASRALQGQQKRREADERTLLESARQSHEQQFWDAYSNYLTEASTHLQKAFPDEYQAFLDSTLDERTQNDRLFDSAHLRHVLFQKLFADFFQQHSSIPVHGFWDWDSACNPQSFVQSSLD